MDRVLSIFNTNKSVFFNEFVSGTIKNSKIVIGLILSFTPKSPSEDLVFFTCLDKLYHSEDQYKIQCILKFYTVIPDYLSQANASSNFIEIYKKFNETMRKIYSTQESKHKFNSTFVKSYRHASKLLSSTDNYMIIYKIGQENIEYFLDFQTDIFSEHISKELEFISKHDSAETEELVLCLEKLYRFLCCLKDNTDILDFLAYRISEIYRKSKKSTFAHEIKSILNILCAIFSDKARESVAKIVKLGSSKKNNLEISEVFCISITNQHKISEKVNSFSEFLLSQDQLSEKIVENGHKKNHIKIPKISYN